MPAIDSRAKITCNLGEVIQGGISDTYLQNSGLIFTRGQLTLVGIQTPVIGSAVTISYEMVDGTSNSIPRDLVVLSAFADPFRSTTEVSIGCKLTYLDGVMPVPSLENGEAAYVTPRQMECLNGEPPSAFVPPIFANDLFKHCCDKLGLAITDAGLSGTYMMDKYDLSGGYVQAMNNLLLSESKIGYMAAENYLEVADLSAEPYGGAMLGLQNIIDVSGINSGEQPASIVIVPYIDKKLKQYQPEDAAWDEVVTIGDQQSVQLKYTSGSVVVTHAPTTKTVTEYGEPISLTDQCQLKDGGFGDLSDTVVKTTTTRTTVLGQASSGYATALLEAGASVDLTLVGETEEITTYEFDDKDRPSVTTTEIYEPVFVYAGRLSLPWTFDDGSYVSLGNEKVLVERTVEQIEYAGEPMVPEGLSPGQDVSEPVVYQRTSRYTMQAWGKTQGGSQGPAEATTLEAFADGSEVLSFIQDSLGLVLTDSEVVSNKAFDPKGQRRPGESDRAVKEGTIDNGGRTTKYVELQFQGQGTGTRVVQYSPPHLTESYFSNTGIVVQVDSYTASATFGRVQHKLAVGNRLGMNITATPAALQLSPWARIELNAAGYVATYAVNGMNWSFSRDGIVASVDALYIGGNGIGDAGRRAVPRTANPPWFYLPEGYDPANLPLASEGQLIRPFNERVNVGLGISLGCHMQKQKSQAVVPRTVELGVALGLDGSNGQVKSLVEVGVAVGIEATGTLAYRNQAEIGVALGLDYEADIATAQIVEAGIKVGVNLGPDPDAPWLLMNFDSDFSDQSPNNHVFDDVQSAPYPVVQPSGTPPSRFGAGCMFRPRSRGSKVLTLDTSFEFKTTWTIEFWLYLNENSIQYQDMNGLLSFKGVDCGWDIGFENQSAGENPWLYVYEPPYPVHAAPGGTKIPLNQWVHVAIVGTDSGKTSFPGYVSIYQDGIRLVQSQMQGDFDNPFDQVCIGNTFYRSSDGVGYDYTEHFMDELRITPGKAIYTGASFNPPTGPF
ncbi:MAG: LamG-like jellyroll fold domain-containing protein [Pseudomonadota bacterium]|nr:LamG-like jellyroll fold domain-containing protein [Pseudomonadota bacterium]